MAKNKTPFLTQAGRTKTTSITGLETIFTAGIEGSKILAIKIMEASTATAVSFSIVDDLAGTHQLYNASTPTDNLDILDLTTMPKGSNGMRFFNLEAGWSLTAINTLGAPTVLVYGEDY